VTRSCSSPVPDESLPAAQGGKLRLRSLGDTPASQALSREVRIIRMNPISTSCGGMSNTSARCNSSSQPPPGPARTGSEPQPCARSSPGLYWPTSTRVQRRLPRVLSPFIASRPTAAGDTRSTSTTLSRATPPRFATASRLASPTIPPASRSAPFIGWSTTPAAPNCHRTCTPGRYSTWWTHFTRGGSLS